MVLIVVSLEKIFITGFIFSQIISYVESGNVLITNIPPIERSNVVKESSPNIYDNTIRYYCQLYGVDPELVKLIIEKESHFNPHAVSKSGAIGLMQLMPETAKLFGINDLYNPVENIKGGIKYLRDLFEMFGSDLELVLAAYHAGPSVVKRLNRVPTFPETMDYVDYIISRYSGAQRNKIYFSLTDDGTPFFTNLPKH